MRPRTSITEALGAVALPFLVSRGGVLIVGLAAAVLIGYTPVPGQPSAWQVDVDPVRNLLARWDSFWYVDIATHGYHWNGHPLEQQNVVFFPLFPLLMRLVGRAIGGHPLLAGLLISLTSFLLALAYLWRWAAERFDTETATGAVWLLSAFPMSVFFSASYTESLYLLVAVAVCYHAERRQFVRSAVFGFLGGLVRPNGLLLAIPVGWLAFVADRDRTHQTWRRVSLIAPVLGVLCFSAYLARRVGDPLAWLAGQAAWPVGAGHPLPDAPGAIDVTWIPNALSLGLILTALVPVTKLLGVAYGLFVTVNVAPPLVRHGLMSLGRFTSVMFPIFVWMAVRVRGPARVRLILVFAVGQAWAAALFFTWGPIF